MGNGWFIWKLKSSKLLIFCLFLWACSGNNSAKQNITAHKDIPLRDSLKSGDLVLRLGTGFFSNYFRKFASEDKIFSHVGILQRTQHELYVYHAEASELTGIGKVKKETLDVFLQGIDVFSFYRIDVADSTRKSMTSYAAQYFLAKTPFDMDFNCHDDKAVYCTELVANSINSSFEQPVIHPTLKLGNRSFYGLDDIYNNKLVYQLINDKR